jgi:hypothetical protein
MFKVREEQNLVTEMTWYELDDDGDDEEQPTGTENDPTEVDNQLMCK